MNYLAHAWLSFHQPFVLAGNMISDFVKGKQQYAYPASVQQGIHLHRSIDAFTDSHPVTREAKT
jgi:acyl carrier protein phosphodiesterase